tara:strand:- start:24 stop:311 length:288 start_codon:yes stop_codon:yes gene_type:complete
MNSIKKLQAENEALILKLVAENEELKIKNKKLQKENNELWDWKDYLLQEDMFRCVDCGTICEECDGDDKEDDEDEVECGIIIHYRCYKCVRKNNQ